MSVNYPVKGGGLAVYLRSDLASDRKKNLECNKIESICVELYVSNKKWLITGMYRPLQCRIATLTKTL